MTQIYYNVLTTQWQFLARDDGEPEALSDVGWIQDEGKESVSHILNLNQT